MLKNYSFNPGVFLDETRYASEGYWVDADKIRFNRGKPQIIGGWQPLTSATFNGICRGMHSWQDSKANNFLAFGTHTNLYIYNGEAQFQDITPPEATYIAQNSCIDYVSATTKVTLNVTNHRCKTGDVISIYASGSADVDPIVQASGGLALIGAYQVSVVNSSTMVIDTNVTTTQTKTGKGTGSTFALPRFALTGCFNTSAGSNIVRITQANHGRVTGSSVIIGDTTPTSIGFVSAGGINLSGEYIVTSVVSANEYWISATDAALSTTTSAGAICTFLYPINPGNKDGFGKGYGSGPYGIGSYGVNTTTSVSIVEPRTWAIDNFGQNMIASPFKGSVYEWQRFADVSSVPGTGRAIIIPTAPRVNQFVFVTPERFVACLGTSNVLNEFDPSLVRWSDQANPYDWREIATTLGGEFPLQGGGRLVAARQSRGGSLIWSDADFFSMTFTSDPNSVYNFDRLGSNCGLMGPNAVIEYGGIVFWVSNVKQFFTYSGGAPAPVINPNRRYFFNNLAPAQARKIYLSTVGAFNEIVYFYPSLETGECDKYFLQNTVENTWANGSFERTAGIEDSTRQEVIWAGSDGVLYVHETGNSNNGMPIDAFIQSGDFDIEDGDQLMLIQKFVPDFKLENLAGLYVTITTRKYPNSTGTDVVTKGPYLINPNTAFTPFKARGRQASVKIESNTTGYWRLGVLRLDVQQDGGQ